MTCHILQTHVVGMADSVLSKICLFVGNLPYSVTDAELEAVFKSYGSLRSCYTVKHKGEWVEEGVWQPVH
jgi:RNA recognition motif-containing protein